MTIQFKEFILYSSSGRVRKMFSPSFQNISWKSWLFFFLHYWTGFWSPFPSWLLFGAMYAMRCGFLCLAQLLTSAIHHPPPPTHTHAPTHEHICSYTGFALLHQNLERDGVSADEGRSFGPCGIPYITCLATSPLSAWDVCTFHLFFLIALSSFCSFVTHQLTWGAPVIWKLLF